jgi:hypothetical protein
MPAPEWLGYRRFGCRPCENSAGRIPARREVRYNYDMMHIIGHDRSQTLLLPESLDDYVGWPWSEHATGRALC